MSCCTYEADPEAAWQFDQIRRDDYRASNQSRDPRGEGEHFSAPWMRHTIDLGRALSDGRTLRLPHEFSQAERDANATLSRSLLRNDELQEGLSRSMRTRSADPFLDQGASATSQTLREQEQSRRHQDDQATIQSLRDQLQNQTILLTANRTWPGTPRISSPGDELAYSHPGREAPTPHGHPDGASGPLSRERRQPAFTPSVTEIHASAWHGQVAHQNQLNIEESLLTSRAMSDQRLREGSIAVNTQREQAQRQDLLRTFDHSSRSVGERATGLIDERAAGAMSGLSTPQFATPNADARAGAASRPLTQASLSTAILQNNHLQARWLQP